MNRPIILTLTRIEVAHLRDLIEQFATLVNDSARTDDPALARLTPAAYPDDDEASAEFRDLTRSDLLQRRGSDAAQVLDDLATVGTASLDEALSPVDVSIEGESLDAWMRTFAALRLVLASRLGIDPDSRPEDDDDPRYGLYEWLGYRLEGLVQAAES